MGEPCFSGEQEMGAGFLYGSEAGARVGLQGSGSGWVKGSGEFHMTLILVSIPQSMLRDQGPSECSVEEALAQIHLGELSCIQPLITSCRSQLALFKIRKDLSLKTLEHSENLL